MKQYITPKAEVHNMSAQTILTSSGCGIESQCSEYCVLWHSCRDRNRGKLCKDKHYT